MNLDKSCKKYKNGMEYPTTTHGFKKPKRDNYVNNESYGIALDVWEKSVGDFKKERTKLLIKYNAEEEMLMTLFWIDLFDEMGWTNLNEKRKSVLRNYLWERGHAYGYTEVLNEAYSIEELIGSFM